MFYIEYKLSDRVFNCNYNARELYLECLSHFRRSGRQIVSHGVRPC